MEHNMKLHHDIKLFSDTLRASSQHLDIKLEFVEKDYWITLVLSRLAKVNMLMNPFLKEVHRIKRL
ncbi:MAG: hypothetical protein EAZ07_09580 [Cytophagales bacterium]|nr:MAG: hypothetical protein EAZ07_09580 [Cytophagales bacterium]